MIAKILLILFVSLISCKENENYAQANNNSNNPDIITSPNCDNADYGDWQSSNYVLPFPVNLSYTIGLSHCTSSYHGAGQPDQFSIDFNMPIASIIECSRAGTVIFVEESGVDYQFPNNKVIVDHGDGTFGQYMHLTKNGASVSVGQNVVQGTEIGLSGATGLAGYPHLHFVVTINDWEYPYDSTPVNFKNTTPNPTSLIQGETYTALSY